MENLARYFEIWLKPYFKVEQLCDCCRLIGNEKN